MATKLDDLGFPIIDEPEGQDADGGGKKGPSLEDLNKTIETLNSKLETSQQEIERMQRNQIAILTGQQQTAQRGQQTQQAPTYKTVSFDGLPDPTENPAEYNRQLSERINATMVENLQIAEQSRTSVATNEQQRAAQINTIWERFQEKYPDLSENAELVQVAASQAVQRAVGMGLAGDTYMFNMSDMFIEDTATRAKAIIAGFAPKGDGEGDQAQGGQQQQQQADQGGGLSFTHRSQLPSGKSPAPSSNRQEPEKEKMLVDELTDIQRKTGYF